MSAHFLRQIFNTPRSLAILSFLIVAPLAAHAEKFTAGTVMQKLEGGERYSFVAGIVEGLAVARYAQDAKKPEGMNCIYDWFYQNTKTIENIYAAFERYPDYPPGSVVDALARKACA